MKINKIYFVILYGLFTVYIANAKNVDNFNKKPEVQKFIVEMVKKYNFEKEQLEILFTKYNTNKEVLEKISSPSESLSWCQYKKLLISNERINKGKIFIEQHKDALLKAEQQFGVPKEIITAILGVESFYGEIVGKFPTLQTLATLAFDYPPREKFFKQELEHFLLLTKEEKLDPVNITGSYAGAMSPAQFISSSYRAYAIDFGNIGTKDLNNMQNAIGSIANYFHKHGWKPNDPITNMVTIGPGNLEYKNFIVSSSDLKSDPKPKYSLQQLNNIGVRVRTNKQIDLMQQAALLEFINEDSNNQQKKEHWVGFNNFYVITRYNKSINYAMAVYQLALALSTK